MLHVFIHSFIHSGDLYSASSRDYYSEALPAQSRTKNKDNIMYVVLYCKGYYVSFLLRYIVLLSCNAALLLLLTKEPNQIYNARKVTPKCESEARARQVTVMLL